MPKLSSNQRRPEAMYDYSCLPTLVLNEIFGYLSVKERVKAKSVCRTWKAEVDLREQKRDTLVLHIGPYTWNMRWCVTNNRGLMKFENSFQVKRLTILKHPLTRALLKKTKKLAIVDVFRNDIASNIEPYLGYLKHCEIEEIEIRSLRLAGTLAIDLPKLKVLMINDTPVAKLVLNCPSLEVLFWNRDVNEVHFQSPQKLKRLACFGWPPTVTLANHFESLEYFNFFATYDQHVNDRLLDRMPRLKRIVLYSKDPQADLEIIRRQQERLGLKNLEILLSGFRDTQGVSIRNNLLALVHIDQSVEQLFENYSKLVEDSPWKVWINYSALFSKFKILPSDFFERFHEIDIIEISAVTDYTHLFGFLKCCPIIPQLKLQFSSTKAYQILHLIHALHPSLQGLIIREECPSDVLKIDLSFMRLFNLTSLRLEYATRLPVEFIRKVAAKRGTLFFVFELGEITSNHMMTILFPSYGPVLMDHCCGLKFQFSAIDQLISHMQIDPHLRSLLL